MTGLHLPQIEDLDVEDLLTLPKGYRYELHGGNLVIMTPSTFWHKEIARRLLFMLHAAGLNAFQDPGVLGDRPRDCRLPDVGVVTALPGDRPKTSYSNLPGSAFLLVVEVMSVNSPNGEFTEKMAWYAERGIPEYWIAEEPFDGSDDDAEVRIYRLAESDSKRAYVRQRAVRLSELEAEYRAKRVG